MQDDYYDSDEDEFLDRTGDLAQKRAQRKARIERTEVVETYASLTEKIDKIDVRIAEIQKDLEASKDAGEKTCIRFSNDDLIRDVPHILIGSVSFSEARKEETEGDCLDSFMKQLKSGSGLDKIKRSQLRLEQAKLISERQQLVKLANIAKPVSLPPLKTLVFLLLRFRVSK